MPIADFPVIAAVCIATPVQLDILIGRSETAGLRPGDELANRLLPGPPKGNTRSGRRRCRTIDRPIMPFALEDKLEAMRRLQCDDGSAPP